MSGSKSTPPNDTVRLLAGNRYPRPFRALPDSLPAARYGFLGLFFLRWLKWNDELVEVLPKPTFSVAIVRQAIATRD